MTLGCINATITAPTVAGGAYTISIVDPVYANLVDVYKRQALTTTGIPTALSCLISANNTLKNKKETNILFISTLYVSFFIAFFISIFISLHSEFLADTFLHNPQLNLFILAICPAVVLITISNVLRSYFYGIKKVVIPAVGQILEQISRILFLILVYYLSLIHILTKSL